jgi:AraC-like DNA-binding protein
LRLAGYTSVLYQHSAYFNWCQEKLLNSDRVTVTELILAIMKTDRSRRALAQKVADFRAQLRSAQLSVLFNYLPGVYFVVKNLAGEVMMANDVALRLCGFERERDMIGKTDMDIFEREKANVYIADDRRVFATGMPIVEQVELAPDPADAINWLLTTKIPLCSVGGEVVGLACIGRDMTHAYEELSPHIEMNQALEYVRTHYMESIRIEDLARLCSMSFSQFERRFRNTFHISPLQHITQVRIRAACNLLTTTQYTIAAIALDVGFYDHSHFSRAFKKVMGVSPSLYRK